MPANSDLLHKMFLLTAAMCQPNMIGGWVYLNTFLIMPKVTNQSLVMIHLIYVRAGASSKKKH